jgi:hypothetical protein
MPANPDVSEPLRPSVRALALACPGATAPRRSAAVRGRNLEFTWRGLELIPGNYYVVVLLISIAATAGAMVVTYRRQPAADEPTAASNAARMM